MTFIKQGMNKLGIRSLIAVALILGFGAVAYNLGRHDENAGKSFWKASPANAQEAAKSVQSPVKPLAKQDVYYPGTEAIGPDEMRVVACGTGMPNARPKQAAACFLVELGNGD
ncbi:MAG: hypothetical protein V3T66_09180, partial [Alphaproteobacteria bacterium]